MDPITSIAASGLRARMESLEMLANNIANSSTGGYKADREFYSLYLASEAAENANPSTMPLVERPWTDLSQGVLEPTGNPLDLALSGKGFFAVNGPDGTLFTRNGGFHISSQGTLVTPEGYPVRSRDGETISLNPALPVEVSRDGTVSQEGVVAGQIAVMDFPDSAALTKRGNTYFRSADPPIASTAAPETSVVQGRVEASNTGSAEAAVRLVEVMRQFEILQKAVGMAGDMNRKAIEVAKVS
jgi:flagellar basal-body rod protein FlgF